MFFLSKFCVLCNKLDDDKLIKVDNKDKDNITIQEKIDYCLSGSANKPSIGGYICCECHEQLQTVYIFKQKFSKCIIKSRTLFEAIKDMQFPNIIFKELTIPLIDIKHTINLPLKNVTSIKNSSNKSKSKCIIKKSLTFKNYSKKHSNNLLKNNCSKIPSKPKLHCKKCNEKFYNRRKFYSHRLIHKKMYQCSICLLKIANKGNLQRHFLSKHKPKDNSKQTVDDIIDLTIDDDVSTDCKEQITNTQNSNKEIHNKILADTSTQNFETNQSKYFDENNKFQCILCDKYFNRHCKLLFHLKIHFEDSPYKV